VQAQTGLACTNAKDIFFRDVVIDTEKGPALTVVNSKGLDTARLTTLRPHPGVPPIETIPDKL
jgi:hypothetical protein